MICPRCLGTGGHLVNDEGELAPMGKEFKCKKCHGRGFVK